MTNQVVVAPLVVALLTAVVTLLVRQSRRAQQAASLLGALGYVGTVALLVRAVAREGILTYQLSAWQAPYGITAVADSLSAFVLAFAAVVVLAAVAFSLVYVNEIGQQVSYHPLFHFMVVGVTGSFLTGDVFNLFVWFEVMLMSSYVLVVFYGGPEHTRAALHYVVLNLLGSAIMLLAIGGLYATVGTLNMADIARRLADPAAYGIDVAPVLGISALLFAVFALKAGIAPFQFWVPAAYRAAPAPVAAMLAGVVKKVGVYAIVRLYFTVFAAATLPAGLGLPGLAGGSFLAFYGPILFVMAAASILVGGVGAVSQPDVDGLLAHSSIGQVGFIVLPLAVAATVPDPGVRTLAIAAAMVYSLNHAIAKGMLFLTSGAIFEATGTDRFADLGGLWEGTPTLAGAFAVGGLSLIGIPPLSGFFGKFLVFDVGVQTGAELVLAVALAGAILTIAYFTRAWNRGFWGVPGEAVRDARGSATLAVVVTALAVVVVLLGIGFDPVMEAAMDAGSAALAREEYVEAVLGGGEA
jgi:multicomponent Na+:H+ antiporter subunit D